ncbi:MAG TPA: hypothetical protein VG247_19785 [Pseudonocardiaceae bacterium]|jgi:hypothetical protein|nr:hypothetical protein [Pseudonocardiaceae bacterium]
MSARKAVVLGIGLGLLALAGCARTVPGPDGAVPPAAHGHADVRIKVTLQHDQVHAGDTIQGTATITNTTGKAIVVHGCPDSWLMVGLSSPTIRFDPAIPANLCVPQLRLAPGPTTYPITVSTAYQACLGPEGHSLVPMPTCDNGALPPLPAGTYRTTAITDGLGATVDDPPVTVTLLP